MSAKNIYIVYETTNLTNGKYYIGVHKINNTNYLGSGKLLKLAIKKYGRCNFMRETLKRFNNELDAYDYEKIIISDHIIGNINCYNIIKGGLGASSGKNNPNYGKPLSKEHRKNISLSKIGSTHSDETRRKIGRSSCGKNNSTSIPCIINGKYFDTLTGASNFFGVSKPTIRYYCNKNIPFCYVMK